VYRHHAGPITCYRCGETFESEQLLESHSKREDSCILNSHPVQHDGFNKEQEKELKSRKRKNRDQTEEQKWNDMFIILFPNYQGSLPSPRKLPQTIYKHRLIITRQITRQELDEILKHLTGVKTRLIYELPERLFQDRQPGSERLQQDLEDAIGEIFAKYEKELNSPSSATEKVADSQSLLFTSTNSGSNKVESSRAVEAFPTNDSLSFCNRPEASFALFPDRILDMENDRTELPPISSPLKFFSNTPEENPSGITNLHPLPMENSHGTAVGDDEEFGSFNQHYPFGMGEISSENPPGAESQNIIQDSREAVLESATSLFDNIVDEWRSPKQCLSPIDPFSLRLIQGS
jgi:hypothetical protein